ncbi:hypothetical protein DFH07DRAFT_972389 [Mycena maculata]|uniref:Uncharacterized protein n=1 Tax=Mycena maculata TaxID=230809 RepID=A0AAD7HIJ7_9AGAR|nr:hypothetical protein DFH07DRAFT_972389 [Mycena maculata]
MSISACSVLPLYTPSSVEPSYSPEPVSDERFIEPALRKSCGCTETHIQKSGRITDQDPSAPLPETRPSPPSKMEGMISDRRSTSKTVLDQSYTLWVAQAPSDAACLSTVPFSTILPPTFGRRRASPAPAILQSDVLRVWWPLAFLSPKNMTTVITNLLSSPLWCPLAVEMEPGCYADVQFVPCEALADAAACVHCPMMSPAPSTCKTPSLFSADSLSALQCHMLTMYHHRINDTLAVGGSLHICSSCSVGWPHLTAHPDAKPLQSLAHTARTTSAYGQCNVPTPRAGLGSGDLQKLVREAKKAKLDPLQSLPPLKTRSPPPQFRLQRKAVRTVHALPPPPSASTTFSMDHGEAQPPSRPPPPPCAAAPCPPSPPLNKCDFHFTSNTHEDGDDAEEELPMVLVKPVRTQRISTELQWQNLDWSDALPLTRVQRASDGAGTRARRDQEQHKVVQPPRLPPHHSSRSKSQGSS